MIYNLYAESKKKWCKWTHLQNRNRIPRQPSGKESSCQFRWWRDVGLIAGLGKLPGIGNDNPLQYSCLENSMDRGAWQATAHGVAKSWVQLSTNAQNRAGQQPQTWRTNAGALGKAGRDRLGVWDWHEHTIIFKIDDQLGPTVQHKEFCSVFCNNLNGKRIWKKKYMYSPITELFCYTPKTNTLLTNYGSI